MLITKPSDVFYDPELHTSLSFATLERLLLDRLLIPQEELYRCVWDFVQMWNNENSEQIDFIERFRKAESFLLEHEEEYAANFIKDSLVQGIRVYRKNINADQIDQIFDLERNQVCWYEEFGFFELGNYLFSRSIAVLQDSNFEVVLVIPNTKKLDLEFFRKNYVPTITSGFLIEGIGRLESRSIKSNLRDLMAQDEFLVSKVALVLEVPDADRDSA